MPNACERWKTEELKMFTETGDASNEFLDHLDDCEYCGKVVEEVFNHQARAFEKFAERVRSLLNKKK